ncbi:hypothetical protein [Streptomyces flavidovirens]|uniref:Uncharacterized protein n=1 Tax=Streptomyces flavidovirens TaxID=67298 RepID=A0ABW6RFQ6_9ACTN
MSFSAEFLLAKSPDELDLVLGEVLLADGFGAKDPSDSEKRAAARRWFQANLAGFRALICGNTAVKLALSSDNRDRNSLLSALIDVLGSQYGMTVPVTALSAQIVHYGVDKLCPSLGSATE